MKWYFVRRLAYTCVLCVGIHAGLPGVVTDLLGLGRKKESLIVSVAKERSDKLNWLTQELALVRKDIALATANHRSHAIITSKHEYEAVLAREIATLNQDAEPELDAALKISEKSVYQLTDLMHATKSFAASSREFDQLQARKQALIVEKDQLATQVDALEQRLKEKEQERKQFATRLRSGGSTVRYDAERLDTHLNDLKDRCEIANTRAKILEQEIYVSGLKIESEQKRLALLKDVISRIDRRLLISDHDVRTARMLLARIEAEYKEHESQNATTNQQLGQKREDLRVLFQEINEELSHPLVPGKASAWVGDLRASGEAVRVYQAAALLDQMQAIDAERSRLLVQREFDKARIMAQQVQVLLLQGLIEGWHRHAWSDEKRQKFAILLTEKKVDLVHELSTRKVQQAGIASLLGQQTKALEHVKTRLDAIDRSHKQNAKLFGHGSYEKSRAALIQSQQVLSDQLASYAHALETITSGMGVLEDAINTIDVVNTRLGRSGGIFQQAAGAISWRAIKSVGPDLRFFWQDLKNLTRSIHVADLLAWVTHWVDLSRLWYLLVGFLLLIALYLLSIVTLPIASKALISSDKKSVVAIICNFAAGALDFVQLHIHGIFALFTLYLMVAHEALGIGLIVQIFFYLGAIFYLCYLTRSFIIFFARFNREHNYAVIGASFEKRFLHALSVVFFSTIIIFSFRQAFVITTYGHSQLPNVLLAIYSLIIRGAFIYLLMGKEAILNALPATSWGDSLRAHLSRYYLWYLALVTAVVVMSDPFVGFGKLVSTVLFGSILTILIVLLFWMLQTFLKDYSSYLFFSTEDETLKERFSYAKTWYALFIVVSFCALLIMAAVLFAKAWGYDASWQSVIDLLKVEIVRVQAEEAGKTIAITIASVLTVVAFIFGSFLLSSMFGQLVLARIFMLLQVDMGVQNTVSRISSWFIIVIGVVVGLTRIGLGMWIPYWLAAVLLGLAWAVKGPVNDFFAYFVILVERSIKIGDYIRVGGPQGEEYAGVVRKITPRSVTLREKNAVHIVVPNSQITRVPIANWNQGKAFFTFQDLVIPVSYEADPFKAREIFTKVFAQNRYVLKNPAPIIRLDSFSSNGYIFVVRGYISSAYVMNQWDIKSDIALAIVREFSQANIKFAIPLHDVFVRQGVLPCVDSSIDSEPRTK